MNNNNNNKFDRLCKRDHLVTLINYITVECKDPKNHKKAYKYPFVASQLLGDHSVVKVLEEIVFDKRRENE